MLTRLPIVTASFFALFLTGLSSVSIAETVTEAQLNAKVETTQELHIALMETDEMTLGTSSTSIGTEVEADTVSNEQEPVEDLLPGCD